MDGSLKIRGSGLVRKSDVVQAFRPAKRADLKVRTTTEAVFTLAAFGIRMPAMHRWTMKVRTAATVVVIALACVWLARPAAAQNQERYKVRLSTVPMDGGMRESVAGLGSASAVLAGTRITITGTFDGLRTPATAARLHSGPEKGVRGAALGDLTVSKAVSGTIGGSIDLTAEQVQNLRKGRVYIQISSEKAPDGNLWGWLLR